MSTGLLITNAGQAAIAADLAGGAALALSHVAWGDANGVPYNPVATQTGLVRERYRATIAAVAVLANEIVVDAILPADTNDAQGRPSHGFNVAEIGLFSTSGTLIGAARLSNGYKPPPSSGQAAIATFRLKLAVTNPSAITVVIDPQAQVPLGRAVRAGWLTVDGVLNTPPANPTAGATFAIGSAPTGAWAGFAGRIAQWVGVWSLSSVPEGHAICDNSQSENSLLRFRKFVGGAWVSAAATDSAFGVARTATAAELAARNGTGFLTPEQLGGVLQGLPIFPEILQGSGALSVTATTGQIVIPTGQAWRHRGQRQYSSSDFSAAQRTFSTVGSTTYHLVWDAPGTGNATPAGDWPNGRFSLIIPAGSEISSAFDTTFDRMLIARVVTSAGNAPAVTALINRSVLTGRVIKTSLEISSAGWNPLPGLFAAIAWARTPQLAVAAYGVDATLGSEAVTSLSLQATRYDVTGFVAGYITSGAQDGQYVSGSLTLELRA